VKKLQIPTSKRQWFNAKAQGYEDAKGIFNHEINERHEKRNKMSAGVVVQKDFSDTRQLSKELTIRRNGVIVNLRKGVFGESDGLPTASRRYGRQTVCATKGLVEG
jgi:hypothetical protein